jgi:hypothetical protein
MLVLTMTEGSINDAEFPLSMRATSFILSMVMNRGKVLTTDIAPEMACGDIWSSQLLSSSSAWLGPDCSSLSVLDVSPSSTAMRCN